MKRSLYLILAVLLSFGNASALERPAAPLSVLKVSSNFGPRIHPIKRKFHTHEGVDFVAPLYSPIRAVLPGVVLFAGRVGGYGNTITLYHGDGISTLYAHCSFTFKKPGEIVKRGDLIALVGATGRVTGPHLHFEVRESGEPIDPTPYLKGYS